MDNLFKIAFEQKWVDVGAQVEKEHTDDLEKAKEIAKDHLREDPDYYKDWDKKEKILFQKRASDPAELVGAIARRMLTRKVRSPEIKTLLRTGIRLGRKRKQDEQNLQTSV